MKEDVKGQIAACARQLFGEKGFDGVSMRDVAQRMDMSVGNLTYHYKKKQDLFNAAAQLALEEPMPDTPTTLGEMDALFLALFTRLWQQVPTAYIAKCPLSVDERFRQVMLKGLGSLSRNGLLREEAYEGQYEALSYALIILTAQWSARHGHSFEARQEYVFCAWGLIHPLLTPKGRADPIAFPPGRQMVAR